MSKLLSFQLKMKIQTDLITPNVIAIYLLSNALNCLHSNQLAYFFFFELITDVLYLPTYLSNPLNIENLQNVTD